jgi:hypothetical protein
MIFRVVITWGIRIVKIIKISMDIRIKIIKISMDIRICRVFTVVGAVLSGLFGLLTVVEAVLYGLFGLLAVRAVLKLFGLLGLLSLLEFILPFCRQHPHDCL